MLENRTIPDYFSFIYEKLLLEMGELKTPYKWKFESKSAGMVAYSFIAVDKGLDDMVFDVWFKEMGFGYELVFKDRNGKSTGDKAELTGRGNVMEVISTVIEILKDFLEKFKPQFLLIHGSDKVADAGRDPKELNSRTSVYYLVLKKNEDKIFKKLGVIVKTCDLNKKRNEIFFEFEYPVKAKKGRR